MGEGLSGEAMRAVLRRGEDDVDGRRECPLGWGRGGESSQLESDKLAGWSAAAQDTERLGQRIMTRASKTSTMRSVPSVSLVKLSPLKSSQVRPWQCSLRPFQPWQTISILLVSRGLGAGT